MNYPEQILWEKVRKFEIDEPHVKFSFSDRLSKENSWNLSFALEAIHEYKRFMFMVALREEPLSPSAVVDEVWHLHLLYTKSYWEDFCRHTLQKNIHHTPTRGGTSEQAKFTELYTRTLKQYSEIFGTLPPAHIWPDPKVAQKMQIVKIDKRSSWIVRKPSFIMRLWNI